MNHLRPVGSDPAVFILLPHHKTGYILQVNQRNLADTAQFDEMRPLPRRFRKQYPVIGHDPHRVTHNLSETGHQLRAVTFFELMEFTAVHQPGDDLLDVERFP